MKKIKTLRNVLLCAAFYAMLIAPALAKFFNADPFGGNTEKRALAGRPVLGIKGIFDYPAAYEKYFNDNFGLRGAMNRANALLKVSILGTSSLPDKVVVGKNGWLFLARDAYSDSIGGYTGARPFTETELEKIRRNMELAAGWLESSKTKYYFFVAPDKHTIYPEYMPANIKKGAGKTRLDQLKEYLDKHSTVRIIDPRDALLGQKSRHELFYKADTHWNRFGGFIGYRVLMEEIAKDFPSVKPLSESDVEITYKDRNLRDLAEMLGLPEDSRVSGAPDVLPRKGFVSRGSEDNDIRCQESVYAAFGPPVIVRGVSKKNLPSLVMYRDSAAISMIPYISEHFRTSIYIVTHSFHPSFVEHAKPDIVVIETVERYLHYFLHYDEWGVNTEYGILGNI